MGNWSIFGIVLIVVVFFGLVAFIMSQVNITNPLTGGEISLLNWLWNFITPW